MTRIFACSRGNKEDHVFLVLTKVIYWLNPTIKCERFREHHLRFWTRLLSKMTST